MPRIGRAHAILGRANVQALVVEHVMPTAVRHDHARKIKQRQRHFHADLIDLERIAIALADLTGVRVAVFPVGGKRLVRLNLVAVAPATSCHWPLTSMATLAA